MISKESIHMLFVIEIPAETWINDIIENIDFTVLFTNYIPAYPESMQGYSFSENLKGGTLDKFTTIPSGVKL